MFGVVPHSVARVVPEASQLGQYRRPTRNLEGRYGSSSAIILTRVAVAVVVVAAVIAVAAFSAAGGHGV